MAKPKKKEKDRILIAGKPDLDQCDNKVVSARYTAWNFFPVAITEQFRRFANVYFLVIGGIMFVGQYTTLYDTAISPWTTLGPLCLVIAVSLLVEGFSDYKRHLNDHETNFATSVVLNGDDEAECDQDDIVVDGNTVSFRKLRRMDVRQGHFCLVKNREMVPADMVLLASCNENGSAYIETSSIDGETNLKLRNSPDIPKAVLSAFGQLDTVPERETMEQAVSRIARFSVLGNPNGKSIVDAKAVTDRYENEVSEEEDWGHREKVADHLKSSAKKVMHKRKERRKDKKPNSSNYVATLTSEPPNASVHTFSGKLTLPATDSTDVTDVPLGAENVLLRGAVIRNTGWIIGLTFFTGTDTKLVKNSFDTPSKFSQLDQLINYTVAAILFVEFLIVFYLASQAVSLNDEAFEELFYVGFGRDKSEPWPYFRNTTLANAEVEWRDASSNWIQYFLLYVTLLNNFIPLSLYVSIEMIQFFMLWLVYSDVDMYDDTTNTRALARSTIISDLGRIEYIFSDKTGTLTQNVMRFKRCSVDGMIFGTPIQKARETTEDDLASPFHPVRQLSVGRIRGTSYETLLTFNAEMFLRVMALCHTVVVEKDIDEKEGSSATEKNADGAPAGFAYQAESPDEGALVSSASKNYDFQVIARDSSGIRLSVNAPSHLNRPEFMEALQSGSGSLGAYAMETAKELGDDEQTAHAELETPSEEVWSILAVNKFDSDRKRMSILVRAPPELGNHLILFCKGADSSMVDAEICGKVPKEVDGMQTISEDEEDDMEHMLKMQVHLGEFAKEGLRTLVLGMKVLTEEEGESWMATYKAAATSMSNRDELLKQAAIAIEKDLHIVGATAIEDKLQKNVPNTIATLEKAGIKLWVLTGDKRETAVEIGYSTHVLTSKMHLTEVPDKGKEHVRTQMSMEFMRLIKIGRLRDYQKAALGGAAAPRKLRHKIQAWLTGLGFALGKFKRSMLRMFMLVSACIYDVIGMEDEANGKREDVAEDKAAEAHRISDIERRRIVRKRAETTIQDWLRSDEGQAHKRASVARLSDGGDDDVMLASEETPGVFVRAQSAQGVLQDMAHGGELSQPDIRQLSLAHLTAHQVGASTAADDDPIVDEDTLSLRSFVPGAAGDKLDFDKKKRTVLEKLFAVDRDVRKGRLAKHLTKEKLERIFEEGSQSAQAAAAAAPPEQTDLANNRNASRALVIEGAALKHLLGDPEYEEILFAVASNCDAVIACRVSPRQKAQLVNLVRENVKPEPITLAIGDGANDVGMIQEAHVGIGISGKEGKQAVNASDFAIAQFRFLETLILIHGRWDFFRLSTVTLFSFYKNAVMAGTIIIFTAQTKFSGTPLYDQWIISFLNFVAAWPIVFTGFFDRCLSKEYVRKHPEVYAATRENQLITIRSVVRWIGICFVHVFVLYYLTVPQQSYGGGITPAFLGLMSDKDRDVPGNGEGGDLKSVGTVTFTCMIILMAYKVMYESRSIVHGRWPAIRCTKGCIDYQREGFFDRLAYSWIGISFLSILFYLFCIATYQLVGVSGASSFSDYVYATNHVLGTRSLSWIIILFIPIIGMVIDVVFKTFSNIYYPTQTQIHLEHEAMTKYMRRQGVRLESFRRQRQPLQRAEA